MKIRKLKVKLLDSLCSVDHNGYNSDYNSGLELKLLWNCLKATDNCNHTIFIVSFLVGMKILSSACMFTH